MSVATGLGLLLVLAAAIVGVYRWRVRDLERRERELMRLVRERTEQLEDANRKLEELSYLDPLTGVGNRRSFEQIHALEWRRAQRSRTPLSLVMADIDHFKIFNDTHGHQAGDRALHAVANALDSIVQRAGDQVVRYGGEEFAALLPETDHDGAMKIAERMRATVEQLRFPLNGAREAHVTISIGVATIVARGGVDPDALIAAADRALYAAKNAGRNCVRSTTEDAEATETRDRGEDGVRGD